MEGCRGLHACRPLLGLVMTCRSALAIFAAGTLLATADPLPPAFDAAGMQFSQTGGIDLDDGPGEFDVTRFEMDGFLSAPIPLVGGWVWLPKAAYSLTALNTSDLGGKSLIDDEELHSLSLSAMAFSMGDGSPWVSAAWARAELASDFQEIDTDDFTFDFAAGGGYRFNEWFTLGLGAAVINLNGDATVYPGVFCDWQATDHLRVGLYGPNLTVECTAVEDWEFSLRGDPAGGVWNVTDDAGDSRSIDFTSYRVGFFASRHLGGQRWLTAGCGMVIGNELDCTGTDGESLSDRDADNGVFGSIGLRIAAW